MPKNVIWQSCYCNKIYINNVGSAVPEKKHLLNIICINESELTENMHNICSGYQNKIDIWNV